MPLGYLRDMIAVVQLGPVWLKVRAPIRGRVCMNMFMIDLTHVKVHI